MAEENPPIKRASLTGLTQELRLHIYDLAWPWTPTWICGSLCDIPGQASQCDFRDGPWALMQTCKLIERELEDLMLQSEKCVWTFDSLTHTELREFLPLFGEKRASRLRAFDMVGWGKSQVGDHQYFHEVGADPYWEHMEREEHSECAEEIECDGIELGE